VLTLEMIQGLINLKISQKHIYILKRANGWFIFSVSSINCWHCACLKQNNLNIIFNSILIIYAVYKVVTLMNLYIDNIIITTFRGQIFVFIYESICFFFYVFFIST